MAPLDAAVTRCLEAMQASLGERLLRGRSLANLTWLRVGGPAEWLFQPGSLAELQDFLAELPHQIPVFILGAGSNLIVRDGGLSGVVIRLGKAFTQTETDGQTLTAGAALRVKHLAGLAAGQGLDLAFLCTIPGTVGGAVRMNAGCYGFYVGDCLTSASVVTRTGTLHTLTADALGFGYRMSHLEPGSIVVGATFRCRRDTPEHLLERIQTYDDRRTATQPTGVRTAGSTFRNPSGRSSAHDESDRGMKTAWQLIDAAGLRGYRVGDAGLSDSHPNFLINYGGASAADLEDLGEHVRAQVRQAAGVDLVWEVARVGARLAPGPGPDGWGDGA